jgi:hypothetical protein
MSTAACAHRDVWLDQVPDDSAEGSTIVGYAGTLITVYWTVSSGPAAICSIDIDGIEHAGLTLDADDMSATMRDTLAAAVRAEWAREAEAA